MAPYSDFDTTKGGIPMCRKLSAVVLVVIMAVTMLPMPASAAFTPRSTDPKKDSTVYEKHYKCATSGNPYTYGDESQCTWYAWGRYKELCGEKLPYWDSGQYWYGKAKSAGYSVGDTPKLGAIACWDNWNHVAVVEKIETGRVYVSQYNRNGLGKFGGIDKYSDCTEKKDANGNQMWTSWELMGVSGSRKGLVGGTPSHYIYLKESSTPVKTTITFNSLTVPGTLTEGTDAMLDGSFTSNNSLICYVKAEVCDAASGVAQLTASTEGKTFGVSTYGPLIAGNSILNTRLDLGKLKAGTYYVRYTVTTKDGTTASKSTANFTVTHAWGGWTVTKAASCGVAGSRKRTCSRCGQAETQTIAALSHNYQKTGSTAAYDIYTCSNCKDSYRVDTVFWVEIPDENDFRSVGLRNFSDQELSCHFIVAQYENGRLVSLTEKALLLPASSGQYMLTPIPRETGSSTWKVFVLDDQGLTPILPELKY